MKKLLVIRFGALGDLLHVSPSFQAVKQAHPDTAIHLLTSPAYRAMAELLPGVEQVWTWDKKKGWAALFKLAAELKSAGIEGVVNLHPSFKSFLITGLLMPVRAAVYHKEKLKPIGIQQRAIARRHAMADFYQPFAHLLGLPLVIHTLPSLDTKALSTLTTIKAVDEQWLGIIPGVGAKRSNRAWEPASYIALMQAVLQSKPDLKVLLIGGPDETRLAETLIAAVDTRLAKRVENHCGRHSIPQTASLLTHCDLVIGGDTGPMHLAAAVGVPLVGIYGPTALARTGPLAHGDAIQLTPPDTLDCWPCELSDCPYTGESQLACMKQITVEQITTAALQLLQTKKPLE